MQMDILYLKPALFERMLFIFFSFNQSLFSVVKVEKRCSSNHPFVLVMDVLMVVIPLHQPLGNIKGFYSNTI